MGFCPRCTGTLVLFPSQGHFLLFVEFYRCLLPMLLVLMLRFLLLRWLFDPSVLRDSGTSGYCLPLQAQVLRMGYFHTLWHLSLIHI